MNRIPPSRTSSKRVALIALALAALAAGRSVVAQPVSEQEVREAYARWVQTLGSHEYRARHLLVATRDEASTALAEIQAGAPFASVASRVSLDSGSKARGGDLGWVAPNHFVREFAAVFRGTQTGLHPEPVKTAFGWHVVLVEESRPMRVPAFEDMRARLEANLQRERATTAASAKPLPSWSAEQWNLLFSAALHTSGTSSYVYRVAQFDDREQAARGAAFGLAARPASTMPEQRARHLIDVDPALRLPLSRLYLRGQTSAPVSRALPDGRLVWSVVKLVAREQAAPLQATEAFKADLAAWVERGLLPAPEQLVAPQAQARAAYWRARSETQIAAVPAPLSPDVEYGNGSTPLLDAILRTDLDMAKALVARGADVNRCGTWGCPIAFAAAIKDDSTALQWVDWLLQAGAKPDARDPRSPGTWDTALGEAAFKGRQALARRLLDAGAAIDGEAGSRVVPIEAAAAGGRQAMVEWLMSRGASVLPRPNPTGIGPLSIHSAALETEDKALIDWAGRTVFQAAEKSPLYRVTMHVEQGGRRIEPNAQGELSLKAAPFKLVFAFPGGASDVQVGASLSGDWLEEVRRGDLRNGMFRAFASGALADADQPDSRDLILYSACPPQAKPDDSCDSGHMALNVDESARKDFHERRKQGGRTVAYVREVDTLVDTAGPDARNAPSLPVARLAGRALYLAYGVPVALGGPAGLRLVHPRYLTLRFVR